MILGVVYAVMLVDFIGLCFLVSFSVPKIQATIALIGLWLCGIAQYSHLGQKNWKLERLFYGRTSAGHVSLGYLVSELFVIMAALISVSLDAMLDTAPSARDAN